MTEISQVNTFSLQRSRGRPSLCSSFLRSSATLSRISAVYAQHPPDQTNENAQLEVTTLNGRIRQMFTHWMDGSDSLPHQAFRQHRSGSDKCSWGYPQVVHSVVWQFVAILGEKRYIYHMRYIHGLCQVDICIYQVYDNYMTGIYQVYDIVKASMWTCKVTCER